MNSDEIIKGILGKKPYLEPYFTRHNRPESTFFLENAKNGLKIISRKVNGNKIRLSSLYNPEQEAVRCLPENTDTWQSGHIIIILGLGNPYLFKQVESLLKPNQICIAIDAHFEMGIFLSQNFQETIQFLMRPGSHMFCGKEMEEGLLTYLDSLPGDKLRGVRIIKHSPSIKLNPEYYDHIEKIIHITFKSRVSDLLTRFEFEKIWIRNIIANSIYFPDKESESGLSGTDGIPSVNLMHYQGILKGIPALLVSAGPSLRHSLPLIHRLKDKCFILACDTSVKVLMKSGTPFHGVITLDAQKHSLFHFQGVDLSRHILFADIVSNPKLLSAINPGGVIFSTTARFTHTFDGKIFREATPGTEYIESFHGNIASIQSGGSVATTAYDLLRFLGAGKILLIGQDLAYTGREIHSTGTHHNEKWLGLVSKTESLESINEKIIRKRETFQVPSLAGRSVLTDFVLNLYRNWFEQSIPECGVPTWNLSQNGAVIEGALIPEDLNSFIASLDTIDNPDILFQDAVALKKYRIELNEKFYSDLKELLSNENLDAGAFFEKYPFTRSLVRKTEVYLKRNTARLSEKQKKSLYDKNIKHLLIELERGLRPYLGGDFQNHP